MIIDPKVLQKINAGWKLNPDCTDATIPPTMSKLNKNNTDYTFVDMMVNAPVTSVDVIHTFKDIGYCYAPYIPMVIFEQSPSHAKNYDRAMEIFK